MSRQRASNHHLVSICNGLFLRTAARIAALSGFQGGLRLSSLLFDAIRCSFSVFLPEDYHNLQSETEKLAHISPAASHWIKRNPSRVPGIRLRESSFGC